MNFSPYTIREGKLVTIKRKYTESYPENRVAVVTPVRQKVLSFVNEKGIVSKKDFAAYLQQFNEESGRNTTFRWVRENKHLFRTIHENGELFFKLSKLGKRVLEKTKVNESININDVLNEDYSDTLIKLTAKKIGADLTPYDMNQIKIGMAVELKHGSKFGDVTNLTKDSPEATMKIVLGNLTMSNKYYTEAKPEDWGELDAEMDNKIENELENPGEADVEPKDGEEKKSEEETQPGNKLDDEEQKDNKEVDNPDKKEEGSDEKKPEAEGSTEETSDDGKDLSEEDKQKMIEFLSSAIDEEYNGETFVNKLTILAKEIGKDYKDLKVDIYNAAITAIKSGNYDVEIEDLSEEIVDKIAGKISEKSEITGDLIKELAKELDIKETQVRECIYEFAKKQYSKKKLTKDHTAHMEEAVKESVNGFLSTLDIDNRQVGKYSIRRLETLEDFINSNYQTVVNTWQ